MALPGDSVVTLPELWKECKTAYRRLKSRAAALNAQSVITRRETLDFFQLCGSTLLFLDSPLQNAATSGLQDFARSDEKLPALDLVAEYATFRTAVVDMQTWVFNNFPKDGSGNAAVFGFSIDGAGIRQYVDINLTSPQLSAFKTRLTTLINTIS